MRRPPAAAMELAPKEAAAPVDLVGTGVPVVVVGNSTGVEVAMVQELVAGAVVLATELVLRAALVGVGVVVDRVMVLIPTAVVDRMVVTPEAEPEVAPAAFWILKRGENWMVLGSESSVTLIP